MNFDSSLIVQGLLSMQHQSILFMCACAKPVMYQDLQAVLARLSTCLQC